MTKKIFIIAGSDSCGGAGIQADIKTATAQKVYSACAISCLTAQNTQKVLSIHNPPIDFLRQQIEATLSDVEFDVIKIGMLGTAEIIDLVSEILQKKAKKIPLILDPVMVATSGDLLLEKNAVKTLKSKLAKLSYLLTPNVDEAEILAEMSIKNIDDMKAAALKIKALECKAVLIKGGHLNYASDEICSVLLDEKNKFHLIKNKRIFEKNAKNLKLHGTGCTLACAIACNIAKGFSLLSSVKKANSYVTCSVANNLKIGKGSNVLRHWHVSKLLET